MTAPSQQAPEPRPDDDLHCSRCGLLWEEEEISGEITHECPPGFLTPPANQQAPDQRCTCREKVWPSTWIACPVHGEERVPEERGTPETPCSARDDKMHCNCWYDGGQCCACGDGGPISDQMLAEAKDQAGEMYARKDTIAYVRLLERRLLATQEELEKLKQEMRGG